VMYRQGRSGSGNYYLITGNNDEEKNDYSNDFHFTGVLLLIPFKFLNLIIIDPFGTTSCLKSGCDFSIDWKGSFSP